MEPETKRSSRSEQLNPLTTHLNTRATMHASKLAMRADYACNCIHCSPPRHARRAFNLHIPDTTVDLNRECFYGPTNDKHRTTRNVPTHVNRVCCTILSMPTALLSYAPLRVRKCCFVVADAAAGRVQYRNTQKL